MTDFPDLKLKAQVNFPARVDGGTGIDIVKLNGTYQIGLDFADFAPPVVILADPLHENVLVWNNITGVYSLAPAPTLSGISSFLQAGAGAVLRTAQDKMRESVSVKDFAATGDGIANDTVAFAAAVTYCKTAMKTLRVPAGVYMVDSLPYGTMAYAAQFSIVGDGRNITTIRKQPGSAGNLLTIGDPAATNFVGNIVVSGLTFDANNVVGAKAGVLYDVVRSSFNDLRFTNGTNGLDINGGVALVFDDIICDFNQNGLNIGKFTSAAGGGFPNLLKFSNSQFVNNTAWGITTDNGTLQHFDSCDIEGNGTTLGANSGGLYVGPGMGSEVAITDILVAGVTVYSCWFEINKGTSDINLSSGKNVINACRFFSTDTQTTNDIGINGGQYSIIDCDSSFIKTLNVFETGAAVSIGNRIENCNFPGGVNYDAAKTVQVNGYRMNGGVLAAAAGLTKPFVQNGQDATSTTPTIVFPTAFKTATVPKVILTAVEGSAGLIASPKLTSVNNTQFTVSKVTQASAVTSTANYTIYWLAIGEAS